MTLNRFIAIAVVSAAASRAATLPLPVISGGIEKGSKEIRGTLSKPSGTLEVEVNGLKVIPLRQLIEAKRLEFQLELENGLTAGGTVKIRHVDGGDSSEWLKADVEKVASVPSAINSVDAPFGGSKVKVFFSPLHPSIGSASVVAKTCLDEKSYVFTGDDLKKTNIEVSLERANFCGEITITLQVLGKNADEPASTVLAFKVAIPTIAVDEPLKEGEALVAGTASGVVGKVRVHVFSGWAYNTNQTHIDAAKARIQTASQSTGEAYEEDAKVCDNDPIQTAEGVVETGRFSIQLNARLNAGDCIVVRPIFAGLPADAAGTAATINSRPVRVKSVLLDWGRVRGYFSVGGAVSHYRQQFSQVDTFIGFTGDTRVWGRLVDKSSKRKEELPFYKARVQLNLFTEARVSVRLASVGATGSVVAAAAAGNGTSPAVTNPELLRYGSDQPGYFQVGLHLPLSFAGMDWYSKGQAFSFFASPIVKFGGQTSDQPVVIVRDIAVDSTKPVTDSARYTIGREETRSGVLPFYGYGFRFGLFRYDLLGTRLANRQVANDPIGYIDFTWGQAKALRTYQYSYQFGSETKGPFESPQNFLDTASNTKLTGIRIASELRPRFNIEGRLKIPYLPALIGVDMDVRNPSRDSEPNQLRFVLAFRIDAQKALGKVFSNEGLLKGF